MPLQLLPLTHSDTLSWTRIRTLAYQGPTNSVVHSRPVSETSIRAVAADRKREINEPTTWHWKIVDTDLPPSEDDLDDSNSETESKARESITGRTIAFATWSLKRGKSHEENSKADNDNENSKPPYLPPEVRLDALTALFTPLRAAQEEVTRNYPQYLMLNSLATHPDHVRRGAAKMLLDWGMAKADAEGLPVYLDTSSMAMGIYEKNGFRLVKWIEFDRAPWGGEGLDWHGCMVREGRGRDGDDGNDGEGE